jgi:serine/threonine protein kinase
MYRVELTLLYLGAGKINCGVSTVRPLRLLELIGAGGMGEVWLAEQIEPVRRRVALKLIKAGMNTREVVARFESERQALAMMDHFSIAKVFEAGSTPQGQPYFAMEYVGGLPITLYADRHRAGLAADPDLNLLHGDARFAAIAAQTHAAIQPR